MIGFIKILLAFSIITLPGISQEIADSLKSNLQSTSLNNKISLMLEDLDFHVDLLNYDKLLLFNGDPDLKWLWTSYAIADTRQVKFPLGIDFDYITLPLYQKYLKDSKLNGFRRVLKIIKLYTAFYLAYCHVKKYGFLKQ